MIGQFGASGFWELKLGGGPVEVIRKTAPDTSWFLTCRVRWFPTTHRKTVRLARPVRLVLERYVTLSRTMIKPVLMSRKYLQENEYKSRQNVSNSR